jgi:hypothetical protein
MGVRAIPCVIVFSAGSAITIKPERSHESFNVRTHCRHKFILSRRIFRQPKRRAGSMPAYYDGKLFTVNFKELSDSAAESLLAHNSSINVIYVHDDPLPNGRPFVMVIDAIQGDGFNPLWLEVEIEFTPGHAPHQFFSDEEIDDALDAGEITLESSGEVYRCSVIGPKQ